ncbi:hypothetical protein N9X38_01985 [Gammaproteobacteria bacterium]|jgi:hypothetical protein|nr:hypothetical protein [Gammaproteobacteria bacterium]MDB2489172.1 hypothetical protein [Gammaproteobacteria bacterium]MDC3217339.1 hypothetical protein [Gammaproteobacteria bacterium]
MEEVIGFGLLALMVITGGLGIKRLFKPKKDFFKYEDEIILDEKMLHYGPFSGSFMYPHRKFILLLTVSSSFLSADWTRTIDGWGIDTYSNENLILHKTGNDTSTNFYLEMARPFCVTSEPTITAPVGNTKYSEDDEIKATMTVDRGKPKDIVLEVGNIIGEGSNIDYVLKLAYFPSIREGKTFEIKFGNSSSLQDMSFTIEGLSYAIKHSERMCMSGLDIYESEMQETNLI